MRTYPTLSGNVAQAFAPGRVNLIGEHTDYNGGLALPFAIGAGVTVTATGAAGDQVEVYATDLHEHDSFSATTPARTEGWRAFVRGAFAVLAESGLRTGGATITISSDLPQGIGVSSSAALSVALCLALIELSGEPIPEPIVVARLCQLVEQSWLGAQTGLLDQLASLHGDTDHATLIDFQDLSVTPVRLALDGHRLVVMNSGERDPDAMAGYNQRRRECEAAASRVGAETLRGALFQDLHMLPDVLARRARHVIAENGRVLEAVDALNRNDLKTLGGLLDASHASLRDNFEVSTPAVEAAVRTLKDVGALGARLMGAGFGGSVIGLLPADTTAPDGAVEVRASHGARLLPQTALP
jgi:galactokinase